MKNPSAGLSLRQNMLWNSAGSLCYLACQWLVTLAVVRLSGGEGAAGQFDNAGILGLAMSAAAVFHCIALYNMRSFQVSDNQYPDGVYTAARLVLMAGSVAAIAVYAAAAGYSPQIRGCMVLYMAFKCTEAFSDVVQGAAQKRERMDIGGKSMLIRGVFTLGAFVAVMRCVQSLPWAIAAMAGAGLLVILLYDVPATLKIAPIAPIFQWTKVYRLLKDCFWLFLSSLVFNAMLNIPKISLEQIHGVEALGIYATVAAPTLLVQTLATYIFTPMLTSFTAGVRMGKPDKVRGLALQSMAGVLAILFLALAAVRFLGAWGLGFLYGPETAAYQPLLYPLVIQSALTAVVWLMDMILVVFRRPAALMAARAAGLAVCLAACPALIGPMGMYGACWAGMLSLGLQALIQGAAVFQQIRGMKKGSPVQ